MDDSQKSFSKIKELYGTLPLTFKSDGSDLSDYRIYGSTAQNGEGVGVRIPEYEYIDYVTADSFLDLSSPSRYSNGYYLYFNNMPAGIYTMSTNVPNYGNRSMFYLNGEMSVNEVNANTSRYISVAENGSFYVLFFTDRAASYYKGLFDGTYWVKLQRSIRNENADKYKIPVVTSENTSYESITTEIYIGSEPLYEGDYISYSEQSLHKSDGTVISLNLPPIPTFSGTTVIDTDTAVKPSEMYIKYGELIEEDIWAMIPEEKIHVYGVNEPQDGFKHNGLAILDPISCVSRHELNGRWDITLTHKIDKSGKWQYLIYENILKVSEQLFRIDTQDMQIDEAEQTITVHANHIFYDLNDRVVAKDTWVSDNDNVAAQTYWTLLSERPSPQTSCDYWRDELNSDSSFIPLLGFNGNTYIFNKKMDSSYYDVLQPSINLFNKTVVDLIIGSDGFINRWGGELYRDNFYFSIRPTIEDCQENGFYLRFPNEIKSLKHTIDVNGYTTLLQIFDMYGGLSADIGRADYRVHHVLPSVTQINIPYSEEVAELLWKDYSTLNESVDIELNELKYNHRYKDKKAVIPRFHVGDKGKIVISGKSEDYRITAVERDEITKDFISVLFKKI